MSWQRQLWHHQDRGRAEKRWRQLDSFGREVGVATNSKQRERKSVDVRKRVEGKKLAQEEEDSKFEVKVGKKRQELRLEAEERNRLRKQTRSIEIDKEKRERESSAFWEANCRARCRSRVTITESSCSVLVQSVSIVLLNKPQFFSPKWREFNRERHHLKSERAEEGLKVNSDL